MVRQQHNVFREGAIAGGLGALTVAVWFLITDLAQGRPLSTPSVLGQVVLFGITDPVVSPIQVGPVVGYTLLHVGIFILFGAAVTHLLHLAMTSALARFALMLVGVVFELFFFMLTFMLFAGTSYLFPWWSVLVANTLALFVMGYYLIGRHQGLRQSFREEPLGAEEGTR